MRERAAAPIRFDRSAGSRLPEIQDIQEIGDGFGGRSFAEFIGLRRVAPGVTTLTVGPKLLNGGGLLLGPVGFALVDFSMASALWEQRKPNERIATINVSINFIQSADEGDLVCHARVDRRNRNTAALTGEVVDNSGRLLITAVGSFAIRPGR
jgi:uncharacterized protein (TIGR00369 family)